MKDTLVWIDQLALVRIRRIIARHPGDAGMWEHYTAARDRLLAALIADRTAADDWYRTFYPHAWEQDQRAKGHR